MTDVEFDTGLTRAELDPERPRPFETPWGTMALFVVDGDVLCVQAFCPHLEGPLFQGSVAGDIVTCPWHSWRFHLRSGGRVTLFGIPMPGPRLVRCDVTVSERGTLILKPPRSP